MCMYIIIANHLTKIKQNSDFMITLVGFLDNYVITTFMLLK